MVSVIHKFLITAAKFDPALLESKGALPLTIMGEESSQKVMFILQM